VSVPPNTAVDHFGDRGMEEIAYKTGPRAIWARLALALATARSER
jgi:hypothetical protein